MIYLLCLSIMLYLLCFICYAQAPLAQAQAQVQAHVQDQVTEPPQSTPHEPAAHVDAVLGGLAPLTPAAEHQRTTGAWG